MKPEDIDTWKRALTRSREQKDEFYKADHDSPIPSTERASFIGLKYFEPDPGFVFEVRLQRPQTTESVIMATSKGTRQLFNKVGYFEFTVAGQPARVQAYQSAERDDPHLFVPFRDATSGKETYGAARYIDLNVEHDDEYLLDFNNAYNPYCAYSDDYVCPLPPHENWLSVPIRAGETNFH
ncbi:MAG: DUF1684 domain-containing protein [Thaumarchaeota archaeon]|nr:DUF1684 domain-containing protein [Nitrososphaerota archaeon]